MSGLPQKHFQVLICIQIMISQTFQRTWEHPMEVPMGHGHPPRGVHEPPHRDSPPPASARSRPRRHRGLQPPAQPPAQTPGTFGATHYAC